MAWIGITEEDVLTVLAGPELDGYREAALADGQPDPVAQTISQVAGMVRGYVGGCIRNRLGAGETIPEKLLPSALDILAVRIPQRVGVNPKPVRKDAHDDAIKLLERVAACGFDIEEPAEVTTETSGVVSPKVCRKRRKYAEQDGI